MTRRPYPTRVPSVADLAGKRVTVVGLGRFGGGLGVTRWLCRQGAEVTVSDKADAPALSDSLRALEELELTVHLGGHEEADFLRADMLVVNPAIPKDMPLLVSARAAGVACTTEINLFLERCGAKIVGVTGTVGKSTTTAMIGHILARRFVTHVGGNIGQSLLESLGQIRPDHLVVLELSSFQLENTPLVRISPHVAVVTNLMPNHLDRHGTMADYETAKKNIFAFQTAGDVLILNSHCQATATWAGEAPGRVGWFDPQGEPFELILPGAHNQANAQAAWAAASQFGIDRRTAAEALREFPGLPHRLSLVSDRGGVRCYNDSKCTTPEGAIVALDAFEPRKVVILVGGYDKGVSFDELADALARRAKAVISLGATKEKIAAAVEKRRRGRLPVIEQAEDFASAVDRAKRQARPGDVLLLSPACASYDMFANYRQRGEAFVKLVGR